MDPEKVNSRRQSTLVDYMKRLGHMPAFVNDEITVFTLTRPDSPHLVLTINNQLDLLESVRIQVNGSILDLASLIFNVEVEKIIATPAAYGISGIFVR